MVVSPSTVSRVTNLGTSGPVNNLLWLKMVEVTELSIRNSMPSVSYKKESTMWSYAVANALTYRVGIGLNFSQQSMAYHTNTILLSLAKSEAKIGLDQFTINPLTTGYKY